MSGAVMKIGTPYRRPAPGGGEYVAREAGDGIAVDHVGRNEDSAGHVGVFPNWCAALQAMHRGAGR